MPQTVRQQQMKNPEFETELPHARVWAGADCTEAAGKKRTSFCSITEYHSQYFSFLYINFYPFLSATQLKSQNSTEKTKTKRKKKKEIEGLIHLNIIESLAMCFESHLTTQSRRCGALQFRGYIVYHEMPDLHMISTFFY